MSERATDDWLEGYRDGGDPDTPEPSENRSHSYRLGFQVRRAERGSRDPLAPAAELRRMAAEAAEKDAQ
jgi:hypothetical protein